MNHSTNQNIEPAILLKNVRKSFEEFHILKGVDCIIPKNKITVLLGFSGSGKSTIMKIIIGLLKADSGHIEVLGQDRSAMSSKQLLDMRTRFGMLFQESALFDFFTVYENVAFPIREHKRNLKEKQIKEIVFEKLKSLELEKDFDKLPGQLSGGMKKRVSLARALALEPEILLYDEPTTGLDPIMTDMVADLILDTAKNGNVTSLVISHDIEVTKQIADQIIFLHDGQILQAGTLDDFLKSDHPLIKRFFHLKRVD